MADILSDIYPIPVQFVDGQQPTAAFLNAWAAQIDIAFSVLARIIGDFDGESSEQATYISNLVRTIGSMGWLDSRLPRGLKYGLADFEDYLPKLTETLPTGSKEALLSFIPRVTLTTVHAGSISGWTKVDTGTSANPGSGLNAANQWTHWSRKIYTTTVIPVGAQIQYEVDPDATPNYEQDYYDTYAPNSGANVIPNIYEIASVVAGGEGDDVLTTLCEYEEIDDQFWIEMPVIRRAMNPALPFDTSNETPLDLINGTVKWTDDDHTPRYSVPPYIFDLAADDEFGQIPDGLCSLWVANGETIIRLVNQNSEEQIRFFIDEGDRRHVRIELPEEYVLPHLEEGQEALSTRYIIAFAGTGLADAIAHVRARVARHAHDGAGEDSLVRAVSISERFNVANYTQSKVSHNHYPQYLLRTGYSRDSDPLNDDAAIMGDLLLARTDKIPGDGDDVEEDYITKVSRSVYFGSRAGPRIFFDGTDTSGYDSANGKLVIKDTGDTHGTRFVTPNLYLGTEASGMQFNWDEDGDLLTLSRGVEEDLVPAGVGLRFGTLIIADGKISFEDADSIDSIIPATMTFLNVGGTTPTWTLARAGEVWSPRTRLEVGEVYTKSIVNQNSSAILYKWIGPEGWIGHWEDESGWASGPPVGHYLNTEPTCPWSFMTGSQGNADSLDVGEEYSDRLDTLAKPPVLKGQNVVSSIKLLRHQLNLDPLISSAISSPQTSGLMLRNVKFVIGIDDDTSIASSTFKACLKRFRVFNGASNIFNPETMSTVFGPTNIAGNTLLEGINMINLLGANGSHEFDFKEYVYVLEVASVNNNGNSKEFNLYGCQLLLSASYIG